MGSFLAQTVYTALMTCDRSQDESSVLSSTPLAQRKCLFPEQHNATDLCSTLHHAAENETVREEEVQQLSCALSETLSHCPGLQITPNSSQLCDSVSFAEIQVNKIDTSASTVDNKPTAWPTVRSTLVTVCYRPHVTCLIWPVPM